MKDHRIEDLGRRIESAMIRHGMNPTEVRSQFAASRARSAVATATLCNAAIHNARALGPQYLRSYAIAVAQAAGGNFS